MIGEEEVARRKGEGSDGKTENDRGFSRTSTHLNEPLLYCKIVFHVFITASAADRLNVHHKDLFDRVLCHSLDSSRL